MLTPDIVPELASRLADSRKRPFASAYLAYRAVLDTLRLAAYGRFRHPPALRRIVGVLPKLPFPIYALWGMAEAIGLRLVRREAARTVFFLDLTYIPENRYPDSDRWVNGRCRDIRKTRVARVFEAVAGYPLAVDPTRCQELMVEKSEVNGVHNGRIVEGPIPKANPRRAYERLVDNVVGDGKSVEDLRVAVVGNSLPLVYRHRRGIRERFHGGGRSTAIVGADDVFSARECSLILEFSRRIGLDFGDLDVLRDRGDGRIYIVDANKTVVSPSLSLRYRDRFRALTAIGEAFEREFPDGDSSARR